MTDGRWDEGRARREEMVSRQIAARGVRDERVLEAMRKVPREAFIREEDLELAFFDGPLSIGSGQTISQPYIVAYMTEILELRAEDRVLEIGTGSGYQTAVLAELVREVYSVECVDVLAERAKKRLLDMGYENIHFRMGDGTDGWPEAAPFDAIMVTAAPGRAPEPLIEQLADGGRMIIPIGIFEQYLYLFTRKGDEVERQALIGVRFVPMTGKLDRGDR
ncbi:MAG: protein-L-isoaspartate(D-aspartate) O-methyltransferase [bacterium]|nr:MAG: protein-L-isoaspartate(D-aspartate) O-methyltransferase [bacterium]